MSSFYDTTRKRLEAYSVFSNDTLHFVAEKAATQAAFSSYQEFFASVDVPLQPTLFVDASGRAVHLVDIDSRADKQIGVMVVHLPMNNSLDANQLYQVAWLAYVYPQYRIIAFGNPSGKPYAVKEQRFSRVDWMKVAFTNNRRAVASVELTYLESQGVQKAIHIGFSYGALKAALLTQYAPVGSVERLVILDPVAHTRTPLKLLSDFKKTSSRLAEYVNRTGLQTFLDARSDTARTVDYNGGLLRSPNIAIGLMIARTDIATVLKECLSRDPKLRVYVAWGSESELGHNERMQAGLESLVKEYSSARVGFMRLEGDSHAFANDLHEYAAIVNEALKR